MDPLRIFRDARIVTGSDTVDLAPGCTGFKVGVAGNVRVLTISGSDTLIPMAVGEVLYLQVTRILATNTTATGIVAFW